MALKIDDQQKSDYEKLTLKQIKTRLEENANRTFQVYSGDDAILMAKAFGITEEELKEKIKHQAIEKSKKETKKIDESKTVDTGKQKKAKGRIIGEIKRKNNPELNEIIPRLQSNSLTEEDYEKLKKEQIDITDFSSLKSQVSAEDRWKDAVKQKAIKYMKDKDFQEEVLMNEIIPEPSKDEIENLVREKIIRKVRTQIEQSIKDKKTQEDQQVIDNEIEERTISLDSIISKTQRGLDLTDDEHKVIEELNNNYSIDVNAMYYDIRSNEEPLKDSIRKAKFQKLKAQVTIGIEKKQKIKQIMKCIKGQEAKQSENIEYNNLICGSNWYIATGKNNAVDICISNDVKEDERQKIEEKIRSEVGKIVQISKDADLSARLMSKCNEVIPKKEKQEKSKVQPMTKSQDAKQEISMKSMKKATKDVTGPEKRDILSLIKQTIEKIKSKIKPSDKETR